jgi:dTDP-4-dehydrorhamnose 3,5-epimerase
MSDMHLAGVRSGRLERHADERGAFRELWRRSALGPLGPGAGAPAGRAGTTGDEAGAEARGEPEPRFVQANLSNSAAGVLRGLHYHRRQLDYWVVTAGRAFVALVDVRPVLDHGSGAIVETREMTADDWLIIPPGVAHGFLAREALELLYLVTNEYDGSDELGFAWDDPAVGVPWPSDLPTPDGRPILSGRDRLNPTLAELVARLRADD